MKYRSQIQTNGVSNTDEFIETLKKFKKLSFSISIDTVVNELNDITDQINFATHNN